MLAQRAAEAGSCRPSILIVIIGHTATAIARRKRFDPPGHRASGQPLRDQCEHRAEACVDPDRAGLLGPHQAMPAHRLGAELGAGAEVGD